MDQTGLFDIQITPVHSGVLCFRIAWPAPLGGDEQVERPPLVTADAGGEATEESADSEQEGQK